MKLDVNNPVKVWRGSYDGVDFEINSFKRRSLYYNDEFEDKWTFYLILRLDRVVDPIQRDTLWLKLETNKIEEREYSSYPYDKCSIINDIDFHGGCTYYSKLSDSDSKDRVIKVGCDYSHLMDENFNYSIDMIYNDVKLAIKSFREIVNYKYWCQGNGKLYSLSEGQYIEAEDTFYSNDWLNREEK